MKALQIIRRLSTSGFSIGGQGLFMLGNMLVFYVLVRNFSPAEFGVWALFLALVSIVDGVRQGLIQNPLTRLLMLHPEREAEIFTSASLMQLGFLLLASLLFLLSGQVMASLMDMPALAELFPMAFLPLFGLGAIQSFASLAIAKGKLGLYFLLNGVYCLTLILALLLLHHFSLLSLDYILLLYGFIGLVTVLAAAVFGLIKFGRPKLHWMSQILDQGKYNSATNLCSLLFQKADIFMIGYFLNPAAVGVFQLATKIIQYVELPLSAFGQTIYPRLAATQREGNATHLNFEYARGLVLLFVLIIPGVLAVLAFGQNLIEILGNGSYGEAVLILLILVPASVFKPLGRVFGLTLESVGLSQINFQMLLFSLVVNVLLNGILIQAYGLPGAAIATSLSTISTILIGQVRLKKYVNVASGLNLWTTIKKEVLPSFK